MTSRNSNRRRQQQKIARDSIAGTGEAAGKAGKEVQEFQQSLDKTGSSARRVALPLLAAVGFTGLLGSVFSRNDKVLRNANSEFVALLGSFQRITDAGIRTITSDITALMGALGLEPKDIQENEEAIGKWAARIAELTAGGFAFNEFVEVLGNLKDVATSDLARNLVATALGLEAVSSVKVAAASASISGLASSLALLAPYAALLTILGYEFTKDLPKLQQDFDRILSGEGIEGPIIDTSVFQNIIDALPPISVSLNRGGTQYGRGTDNPYYRTNPNIQVLIGGEVVPTALARSRYQDYNEGLELNRYADGGGDGG